MAKVLPLHINALYLDQPRQVIGQDIRFENIPWMNGPKEVFENPNIPFDTSSIIPRPFSYDNAVYLEKGVHLHFTLPDFFKKFDDAGNLPQAPNRWYIMHGAKEWIIESDYIWDINDPDLDKYNTCSYLEGKPEGDFTFSYVGRKYSYREWRNKKNTSSHQYLGHLTAMGWGSLSFDMHFANCRSIFGFHDPAPDPDGSYIILGWVEGNKNLPFVAGNFRIKNEENPVQAGAFSIAVANTLPEALTALMVENLSDEEETPVERLRKEEQIESLLNAESLNDQKLDRVSRLRHQQHEKQFSVTGGFSGWQIKAHDLPVNSTVVTYEIEKLFSDEIRELNRLQRACDAAHHHFHSDLENAYIDWSNYLSKLFLEKSADNELNTFLQQIGSNIDALQYREVYCGQLAGKIDQAVAGLEHQIRNNPHIEAVIDNLISKIDDLQAVSDKYWSGSNRGWDELTLKKELKNAAFSKITIERKNKLNFYEALPPTVIISASDKNPLIRTFNDREILPEPVLGDIQTEDPIDVIISKITGNNVLPVTEVAANVWKTYKVEWHAEFLPKKNGHYLNTADENFSPDFLSDTYQLDEQNADLIKNYRLDNIAYHASANSYYGNSFVDSAVKDFVLDKITGAKETADHENTGNQPIYQLLEQYRSKLNDTHLFEFTLSDFNNLMIQRSSAMAVLPLIPNGFQNHKKAAGTLHALLNRHKGSINLLSTNRLSVFNPLRNGALSINRLRIVDGFGREEKLYPDKIITTKNQTFSDKENWVILPPRLLQPAALDVTFDYHTSATEKSPVIGWMIPVFLNQHLEFFDNRGAHIGAVNDDGQWESTPFNIPSDQGNKTAIEQIENADLRNTVNWFLEQSKKPGFMAKVIREIQHNLEHIAPEHDQNPSLMETIASIPIAITKIDYQLVSKGKSVYNIKNKEAVSDHSAHENGLGSIRFPVRFGDVNQYNDGLIGYWHKDPDDFSGQTLYINSETVSGISSGAQKSIQVYHSVKSILHAEVSRSTLPNAVNVLAILKKALKEGSKLADILNRDMLNTLISSLSKPDITTRSSQNIFERFTTNDLINPDMKFLLDRFTNLLNPGNFSANNISGENKNAAGTQFEALVSLLENIQENKGSISKAYLLKQFTEKGNLIWDTLQELHIIPQDDLAATFAMTAKTEDSKGFTTINGREKSIIALLHPKASLFFKSGILPEKNITLPYNEIKDALRKIELTLLTSPIITPKESLQISLLKDTRYKWSWIDLQKTKKEKLSAGNKPVLNRISQDPALKNVEEKDLRILKNKGLIDEDPFFPDENLYYIHTEKYREFINRKSLTDDDQELIRRIESSEISIPDFTVSNPDIPKLVLKEGWISIKSTQL